MSTISYGKYEKYGISYDTLQLTDGDYTVTVTPEKGGMVTSFAKKGDEYLWLRDKNFESTDRPRCGVPILFPSCSKPDGGVHIFNGTPYPMENHGFADLLPWDVEKAEDDEIVLSLKPNGLTKFVYPYDFLLNAKYTLEGNKLGINLTVKNPGRYYIPFSVGFHPYFACSALENADFDITCQTCGENPKTDRYPSPDKIVLNRKKGADNSVLLLTGVKSPMVYTDKGTGHKVTVEFDEGAFGKGVLWQQDAERFVCMEPWNGWQNSVNEAGNHEILAPGEEMCFVWSIAIE